MIERHLARLRLRHEISESDVALIRGAIAEVREIPAGRTLVEAGERLRVSTLVLDGLLCRYKDMKDGQRQIAELHVPGDFADLHSYTLKRLDHSILTLTPCRVAVVPHVELARITKASERLAYVYWFSTNLDAAIHREWVLSLGRRNALARMAALFCELQARLQVVALADQTGFALPLNQTQLAECLGLTSVHVNRVLKELRTRDLVTFRGGHVSIRDLAGLQRVAEFDPGYLYLERQPAD
ncbi:CRP-like cAMP-binding protein [Sphingomonas naasensis]|uniref:Crp/Fnr family transcriptional regulator n=1 Tax=Sphingomonas naasensis TaxID=1344951 RepID=A0A4V3QWZ2_9SPHN|nr:Crp/Fnr family transcriptional regulator [Sphingomonas naasensis]NIJ20229.1 CRP-like cAMP-binding protein [Sphingomonas naasensis]TGX44372.1 Crp/Fnr family transcriptional regulator [Sphingomonas naasensis]